MYINIDINIYMYIYIQDKVNILFSTPSLLSPDSEYNLLSCLNN